MNVDKSKEDKKCDTFWYDGAMVWWYYRSSTFSFVDHVRQDGRQNQGKIFISQGANPKLWYVASGNLLLVILVS